MAQSITRSEAGMAAFCKFQSDNTYRAVVSHLESDKTGILDVSLLLYRGSKSNKHANYHSEMNGDVFLDWLEKKVFPAAQKAEKKTVPVLDRAPYRTMLAAHIQTFRRSCNKGIIYDAIKRSRGPQEEWTEGWETKDLKEVLWIHAESIALEPKYLVQGLAEKFTIGFHI